MEPAKPRLVICDDGRTIRLTIAAYLGSGYEFLLLESGEELLEKAAAFRPDLIISDLLMEGIDGYEVCRRIKQDPLFKHVPVIILTAKNDDESRATGLEIGADDYLFKPIRARELNARVKSLLKLRNATLALEQSRREVQDILQNIQQAVFTVGTELKISREFSRHVHRVFGEVPFADLPLTEVLAPGEAGAGSREKLDSWLRLVFSQPHLDWAMLSQLVDREYRYVRPTDGAVRELQMDFQPIREGGSVHRVMVVAEDLTEKRALERSLQEKVRENEDNLEQISELIQVDPRIFEGFLLEAERSIGEARRATSELAAAVRPREVVERLFRQMHTLKGNARSFRLNSIAAKAHWVEDTFAKLLEEPAISPETVAQTLQRITDLEELFARVRALAERVLAPQRDLGQPRSTSRSVSVTLSGEQLQEVLKLLAPLKESDVTPAAVERLEKAVRTLALVPMSKLFRRFPKMVRDLADELGKEISQLNLEGGDETSIDAEALNSLGSAVVHVLRNAIDHGLETPAARRASGKPPGGTLTVRSGIDGDSLFIDVVDDGKGLDGSALARKAVERGLISPLAAEQLTEAEARQLIFLQGVSTAAAVSEISGRGVGMGAVQETVQRLGGEIALESRPGQGTRVRLTIPLRVAQGKI